MRTQILIVATLMWAPLCVATPNQVKPTVTPTAFIQGLSQRVEKLSASRQSKAKLHQAIAASMARVMDYELMSQRVLGAKTWSSLPEKKKVVFRTHLAAMVEGSYVKRFRPGVPVKITFSPKVREGKQGRAQVTTTIEIKRSSAVVRYSMSPHGSSWRIYDLVIDDVSQLNTYRKSFRSVLRKEGWDALIERMRKSAS